MSSKKKLLKSSKVSKYEEKLDELKPHKSNKNEWRKYGKNLLKVYNYYD